MTLQNVHVQRGPASVVISATWRHPPPPCGLAAALEDATASPRLPANVWLERKFREWKNAV